MCQGRFSYAWKKRKQLMDGPPRPLIRGSRKGDIQGKLGIDRGDKDRDGGFGNSLPLGPCSSSMFDPVLFHQPHRDGQASVRRLACHDCCHAQLLVPVLVMMEIQQARPSQIPSRLGLEARQGRCQSMNASIFIKRFRHGINSLPVQRAGFRLIHNYSANKLYRGR